MKVNLISHTPNPDRTCAEAAYTTISSKGLSEIEKLPEDKVKKILKQVVSKGHHAVLEHAQFTFSIEGVSRVLTHQLVRHRIASYCQQSQRYVKFDKLEYILPRTIKGEARDKYEKTMDTLLKQYKDLVDSGVPAEDARYIFPNAAKTNIVVSMNARALHNFFNLRCCLRAQWEIQELAYKMLAEAKKVAPIIFEDAGPYCKLLGFCREKAEDCPLYPK